MFLRVSTAAAVLVGPVLDSSGTAVTAGVVVGDFTLTKNGTAAALAAPATATHSHNGHWLVSLGVGNTDTLGRAVLSVNNASYAMSTANFDVISAVSYNRLVTGLLGSPRALDNAPDATMSLDDADWSAIGQGVGRWTFTTTVTPSGAQAITTPAGTLLRTLAIDSLVAPTSRT